MHTDATHNKKPTGSAKYPAGHTDSPSISGAVSLIKSRMMAVAAWWAVVLKGVA
jgi:hypothetical protein